MSKSEELNKLLPDIKTALDRWVTSLIRHELLDKFKLLKELNDSKIEKTRDVLEIMFFTGPYENDFKFRRTEASVHYNIISCNC